MTWHQSLTAAGCLDTSHAEGLTLYSSFTLMLTDGAGEPRGIRKVDLLQSDLCIHPLQVIHRYLAKYQMIQAKLFLFIDKLEHTELLCMEAFRGKSEYSKHKWLEPPKEDDVASTAESGIAHFL